jgi:hypothetical protein
MYLHLVGWLFGVAIRSSLIVDLLLILTRVKTESIFDLVSLSVITENTFALEKAVICLLVFFIWLITSKVLILIVLVHVLVIRIDPINLIC